MSSPTEASSQSTAGLAIARYCWKLGSPSGRGVGHIRGTCRCSQTQKQLRHWESERRRPPAPKPESRQASNSSPGPVPCPRSARRVPTARRLRLRAIRVARRARSGRRESRGGHCKPLREPEIQMAVGRPDIEHFPMRQWLHLLNHILFNFLIIVSTIRIGWSTSTTNLVKFEICASRPSHCFKYLWGDITNSVLVCCIKVTDSK